jgi:Uma2 family endonuclease
MVGLCSINDGKFMNVAWTKAAEGFPRRAFTVEDVRRMIEAGVLGADEKFELIEGEIVPVSPSHDPHERVKSALILRIARALPDALWLSVESSIYLAERTFVEPDLCIYERSLTLQEVKGPDLQLVIEIADSTLAFDLGPKAQLYASFGVRELWVVNANTLVTMVHTGPTATGWASIREVAASALLHFSAMPGVTMRLAEIER